MKQFYFTQLSILFLLFTQMSWGQIKLGENPQSIDPTALLELQSTSQGLLLPRMTSAQRDAIPMDTSPVGLVIFNTDTNELQYLFEETIVNAKGNQRQVLRWESATDNSIPFTQPSNPEVGELYYDRSGGILHLWDGNQWIPVGGPNATTNSGGATTTVTYQNLSLVGNQLSISNGNTVDLSSLVVSITGPIGPQGPAGNPATDDQSLALSPLSANNTMTLAITGGNTITLDFSPLAATGLVSVTESGRTGHRLATEKVTNHGDIGNNSIDLSIQTAASSTRGATGNYAFASGINTIAAGNNSFAAGRLTTASGQDAVALGAANTVSGTAAFAMGDSNTASASTAVAIGRNNSALGQDAVALGAANTVSGTAAFAVGDSNRAYRTTSVALGRNNTASGQDAVALGAANVASGTAAFAVGDSNRAYRTTSVALGRNNTASGQDAVALGATNIVSGTAAFAVGDLNQASASTAIAMGKSNKAHGLYSVALGNTTTASGTASFASGSNTNASGDYSFTGGQNSSATGNHAIALGRATVASGTYSMAYGNATQALGFASTAWGGTSSVASGSYSTSWGSGEAKGDWSTAFGRTTQAEGNSSYARGLNTIAKGNYSSAWGISSITPGSTSTAWGWSSTASGSTSTAGGVFATAESYGQTSLGLYNTLYTGTASITGYVPTDRLFVIGNGTSTNTRSDALVRGGSIDFVAGNVTSVAAGLNSNAMRFYTYPTLATQQLSMVINSNGNVGIGDATPTEATLVVSGTIRASSSITANATLTPDYVFEHFFTGKSALNPAYAFPTLEEIESFVKENHHLPGIPSAEEVKEQGGIVLNRAAEIQLEKIEELYLHTIEQQKQIEAQQKEIDELKALLHQLLNHRAEKK